MSLKANGNRTSNFKCVSFMFRIVSSAQRSHNPPAEQKSNGEDDNESDENEDDERNGQKFTASGDSRLLSSMPPASGYTDEQMIKLLSLISEYSIYNRKVKPSIKEKWNRVADEFFALYSESGLRVLKGPGLQKKYDKYASELVRYCQIYGVVGLKQWQREIIDIEQTNFGLGNKNEEMATTITTSVVPQVL